MFNTLSSYFFGSSTPQEEEASMEVTSSPSSEADAKPCRLKETQAEEEWVLVDKSSREGSPERCPTTSSSASSSSPEFVHPASRRIPPHTTLGLHNNGDTSGDSDIGSDISTLPDNACSGETWLVTPPPCFTAGGSSLDRMEQNPLENLLIEHPSMSVYGPRLRQNSAGMDSDLSESSEESSTSGHIVTRSRAAPVRSSPRRPRAVAARAGLSTNQHTVKAAQVAHRRNNKRQLSANQLTRNNKVRHMESRGVRQRHNSLLMQPGSRACKRC